LNEEFVKEKKKAAKLSIVSNSFLIVLKFVAGFISGSIGIISEAIHSGTDLLASFIAYFSISKSSQPADKEHPYGHDKYEDFAGFVEGLLIIFAAFYIIHEAVKKILNPELIELDVDLGLLIMGISIIANFFVSGYLFKVAQKTTSMALHADGEHLRTDVYSSLAVFLGLLFVKVTDNPVFDPVVAICVAVIIFFAGYRICRDCTSNLLDTSLSENENSYIRGIIGDFINESEVIEIKNMRTRKAGMKKNIDITLSVNGIMPISQAHELCDRIEKQIEDSIQNTDITIHVEPHK